MVHSKQVRQRKQHRQLVVVLHQSLVAGFDETKLTFNEPERVLNLGPDTGLEPLELDECLVLARVFFERRNLIR